jgi:predicted PurR-regulated permease PerM
VVVGGLRSASFIVSDVFLALVLTIAVYPAQTYVIRRGWPRWSAFLVGALGVFVILIAIVGSVVLALARFASLLPSYQDEAQQRIEDVTNRLDQLGIHTEQQQSLASSIDPARLVGYVGDLLGELASISSSLFFILTVLFFMAIDSYQFPTLLEFARNRHPQMVDSLISFARGTRTYLVVSSGFGFIVAVIDVIALALLGIPAPFAWGVLSFVTNYIPNIGFVVGLVPPAALAYLEGGPGLALAVIAAYSVINFVIQSLIQPKIVGNAVGLTPTITMVSLVFWAWVLGALGALLAIPLSLLAKAVLVDADRDAGWLQPLISGTVDQTTRFAPGDSGGVSDKS